MRTKEEIMKDIKLQEQEITIEEKINKDSGELSFLYYQLYVLKKELNDEYGN